jgi:hypothetical protein
MELYRGPTKVLTAGKQLSPLLHDQCRPDSLNIQENTRRGNVIEEVGQHVDEPDVD